MSSGVRYTLVETNTTDFPNNSGTSTYNRGFNVPGGPLANLIFRIQTTVTDNAIVADYSNVISSLRIVINGNTQFDYRGGYASASNNAPGLFGYFLNSIGGRAIDNPISATAKEAYFVIPIGTVLPAGVSRIEYTITYAQLAEASSAGTMQVWMGFNTNMQTTTTVPAATSYQFSGGSEEQVTVRIPQGNLGTVAGLMISNDSAADDMSGIRVVSQSDFTVPLAMWQVLNSDAFNGVMYADDDTSTAAQQYATGVAGGLFVPLFGLAADADVVLQVTDSGSATTRLFQPVLTKPVGNARIQEPVQTQALPANVDKSILRRVED